MASVTAESDGACAGREVVIADGVEHGNRRLLVHRRPDDRKLIGLGWPRHWNALRGRPRGGCRHVCGGKHARAVLLACRYGTHCDWPVYLPAFVLNSCSAPDKPRRASRKRTVPTMANVITSTTAFASTMSTASASSTRPLAITNRQSFSPSTTATRLTRSLLRSVRSQVERSPVTP